MAFKKKKSKEELEKEANEKKDRLEIEWNRQKLIFQENLDSENKGVLELSMGKIIKTYDDHKP